jgi:hypothetical protein
MPLFWHGQVGQAGLLQPQICNVNSDGSEICAQFPDNPDTFCDKNVLQQKS